MGLVQSTPPPPPQPVQPSPQDITPPVAAPVASTECPEPYTMILSYPTFEELKKEFKKVYESAPNDKKIVVVIKIDEKSAIDLPNFQVAYLEKSKFYDTVFKRYFGDNTTLEEALKISETSASGSTKETFLGKKNNNLVLLIILFLMIVYRKQIYRLLMQ